MQDKYKQLLADVEDEIGSIECVLKDLSSLRNNLDPVKIDNAQKAAIGTFLMNFYTGVENIIKRISKEYYQTMPKGESWHKELLDLSYNPPQGKMSIFNPEIANKLNPYRRFRHLFISGYGFKLEFELMVSLIDNVGSVWIDIKKAITDFFEKL
ncbi:MAG: hypothetical protein AB1349_11785 [Elusimicrobiota bacterium]